MMMVPNQYWSAAYMLAAFAFAGGREIVLFVLPGKIPHHSPTHTPKVPKLDPGLMALHAALWSGAYLA
jgi:hypothetical protein